MVEEAFKEGLKGLLKKELKLKFKIEMENL
jgi:hypothetical protein